MLKRIHIRLVCTCLVALIALAANAQRPAITERLANNGQVTVDAPKELVTRNNNSVGGNKAQQQQTTKAKDKKKVDPKNDDEKFNDLDEVNTKDEDKKKEDEKKKEEDKKKKDEPAVKKPKRNHTSQQTIESRGVGYRIQAYTDNNSKTGKAGVQQRAREIAMKFPQYRSYISYKAPSWRLRIGDFKSQADAQAALRRIKSVYPQFARGMVIVKDRINVWSND